MPSQMKSKGFTLIEVLITILLLGIGLLGMAGLTLSTLQNNDLSEQMTMATNAAEDVIEKLKAMPYGDIRSLTELQADSGLQTKYLTTDWLWTTHANFPGVTRAWTVTNDTPIVWTKTVTVTVTYLSKGQHQVQFSTIIRRP